MGGIRLDSLLDAVHGRSLFIGLLGLGGVFLVGSLLVLIYTRWGTFNPLRKCLALGITCVGEPGVDPRTVVVERYASPAARRTSP